MSTTTDIIYPRYRVWTGNCMQTVRQLTFGEGGVHWKAMVGEGWSYVDRDYAGWTKDGGTPPEQTGVLMQWTGLRDINGVRVYDGDIIEEKWEAIDRLMDTRYIIKHGIYEDDEGFDTIGFYCDYTMNKTVVVGASGGGLWPYNKRWRVIGNVWENPQLITPPNGGGAGARDDVPAMLAPGSFVIPRASHE